MNFYERYKKLQQYHGVSKLRGIYLRILWVFVVFFYFSGISFFSKKLIKKERVDVLFVFTDGATEKRFDYIIKLLSAKKIKVRVIRLDDNWLQIKSLLLGIKHEVPSILLGSFCATNYLVTKYTPQLGVISTNSNVFPGMFRAALNAKGARLINIAHGTGHSGIAHTSSDFDYWFVFGQPTIDGKLKNMHRVGSTKAIIIGSPFIFGDSYKTKFKKNTKRHVILITSQWVPQRDGYESYFKNNRQIMLDFISNSPNYNFKIKLHHHETSDFWETVSQEFNNVSLFKKNITLEAALEEAYVCLHMSSNACMEAGLMDVPSIAIDVGDYSKHLELEGFLPVIKSIDSLLNVYEEIDGNYGLFQRRAKQYALKMYGGYSCGAGLRVVDYIERLLGDEELCQYQSIGDTSFLNDKVN